MIDYNELARYINDVAVTLRLDTSVSRLESIYESNHRATKLLTVVTLLKPTLVDITFASYVKYVILEVEEYHTFYALSDILSLPSKMPTKELRMLIDSALRAFYYATVITKQYKVFN